MDFDSRVLVHYTRGARTDLVDFDARVLIHYSRGARSDLDFDGRGRRTVLAES